MKTIYCLGRSPQFKLPCVKYKYLLKESDNKINQLFTLPKNNYELNEYQIDDIKNMDEEDKKEIVNQMIDEIYPNKAIKRCMKINNLKKLKIRKYLKRLKESLSDNQNIIQNQVNIQNFVNNKNNIKENKQQDYSNNSKIINQTEVSKYDEKNNMINEYKSFDDKITKNKKNKYLSGPSRNKNYKNNLSQKYFNYNYPISIKGNVGKFSFFTNNKFSDKDENIKFNTIDTSKDKNNKNIKLTNNSLNTEQISTKKRSVGIQLSMSNKADKGLFQRKYLGNIFHDSIEKQKRKKGETQDNELNIIYSETREQFNIKYDKYRKNENLKGLGLANINYPPKLKFKDLNKKISEIKKKVVNVKSIVDNTFPKVLAYMTLTKKEYERSLKEKLYKTPYKEKLNMMEKHQKYINLYLSSPIEIISRNKK